MPRFRLLVTCEHGGNSIPKAMAPLFASAATALNSHRGHDMGAAKLAKTIAAAFRAPLYVQQVSRLLIDNNRSTHHPRLFSEFTKELSDQQKTTLLARYYHPHRKAVAEEISKLQKAGSTVLHVAVHSFTPVLNGEVRAADIGLLYDPSRKAEATTAREWKALLTQELPGFRTRANYPYRGKADGFTTYLRKQFPAAYRGIELELNQKHVAKTAWTNLEAGLVATLKTLLA